MSGKAGPYLDLNEVQELTGPVVELTLLDLEQDLLVQVMLQLRHGHAQH